MVDEEVGAFGVNAEGLANVLERGLPFAFAAGLAYTAFQNWPDPLWLAVTVALLLLGGFFLERTDGMKRLSYTFFLGIAAAAPSFAYEFATRGTINSMSELPATVLSIAAAGILMYAAATLRTGLEPEPLETRHWATPIQRKGR